MVNVWWSVLPVQNPLRWYIIGLCNEGVVVGGVGGGPAHPIEEETLEFEAIIRAAKRSLAQFSPIFRPFSMLSSSMINQIDLFFFFLSL